MRLVKKKEPDASKLCGAGVSPTSPPRSLGRRVVGAQDRLTRALAMDMLNTLQARYCGQILGCSSQ